MLKLLEEPLRVSEKYQETFDKFLNRGKPPCDYERQLIEKHPERIRAIFEGKIIPPYEVEIQPTSICNLDCKHCFGKALTCKKLSNKIGKLEMEIIAQKIDEFQEDEFKTEVVKFCGTTGEPLVNPVTLYGIRLFKNLGKKVILFTNGLFLDKGLNGKNYSDYIINADEIVLSLDSGSEKTFQLIKGKSGFNRITNSLEDIIRKRTSRNPRLRVVVSYVIGKDNYHEIIKSARFMKETGIDEMRFRVDFTNPDMIKEIAGEVIPRITKAQEYEDDNFVVIPIYSDKEIGEKDFAFNSYGRKCFNQHFWACIGPDAELYACGHRTYHEVKSYGNLLNHSFKELWTSQERLKNLKSLPDEYCKFCSPSSSRRNTFMTFLSKNRAIDKLN